MENKLMIANMEQARSIALPPVSSNFIITQTQRFQSTQQISVFIEAANLFGLLGAVCIQSGSTTLANIYSIYSAVRIRKIEMWAPPANTNIPVSVGCEFVTRTETFGSSGLLRMNTSVGSNAGHLVRRPPKNSLSDMWICDATSDVIVELYGPTNTIVDITYSAVTQDDTQGPTVVATGGTFAGFASNGRLVVSPLDGYTSGFTGGLLQPVLYAG